ncbi:protein ALP1-like [Salvia miltiorrhiza]|uniref:protein ALP1-like n=1 Tax=Salvia miltiorrhiza TaxID=226208 RepID=UPI0025AD99A5|nr:protein ALP1-like [Salvia miltiorrhiza]
MSSSSSSHEDERCAEEFSNLVQQFHQIVQDIGDPEEQPRRRRRGARKKAFIRRDREAGAVRLHADYFDENPVYPENIFRRRFRMRRALFLRIVNVVASDPYFQQRTDALGRSGFTPLQKCTVAVRMLANGGAADQYDEYLRIAESTSLECLQRFSRAIIQLFGAEYLRRPTSADCQRLLAMHEAKHGFPGMLGSLDCMHWAWKNCPTAWQGAYTRGDQGEPTIILETVASQDLWIWHAFFGTPGSNNDINVLNNSTLFNDRLQGMGVPVTYEVNNSYYTSGYYLTDGIYPNWPVFVKSPTHPTDPKGKRFKVMQEAARKDIERAFGVLQARWAIVKGPARLWSKKAMSDIMFTCIILHNMIIEDEGEQATQWEEDADEASSSAASQPHVGAPPDFRAFVARQASMRDAEMHARLTLDLKEHIWSRFGPIES